MPGHRGWFSREDDIDRLVMAGLIGAFAALFFVLLPHGLILNDEGWVFHPVLRMLDGEVLYRDVFVYYAPLRYHLLEAVFAATRPSLVVGRTVWVVLLLLTIAGTYRVARRFSPPWIAWIPAATYGLAPGPWHKSPYGLCTVAFLLALARVLEQPTRARLTVLGLAAGTSLVTRQELGVAQLAIGGAMLGLSTLTRARSLDAATLRAASRDGLLLVACFAAVALPFALYYASRGALSHLVDAVFVQAWEYSANKQFSPVSWIQRLARGDAPEGHAVARALLVPLFVYPVALALLVREFLLGRTGPPTLLGVAVLLHSLPALLQSYVPPLLVRFLQSAIPLYLLVAWSLGRLPERIRVSSTGAVVLVAGAFVAAVVVGFPQVRPSGDYTGSLRVLGDSVPIEVLGDTLYTDLDTASDIGFARGFFSRNTRPGEAIFTAPLHSLYYVLLERANPTRFVGDIGNLAMSAPRQRLEVRRLLESDVRWALADAQWWSKRNQYQPVGRALKRHFEEYDRSGSIVILERKGGPASATAGSP